MIPVDGTCRIDPDESGRSVLPGSSAGSWHYAPHCDNTNRPDSEQYEPDDLHDDDRTTRTDRYVAFSRQPLVSVFHSPLVLCIMCLLVQRIGDQFVSPAQPDSLPIQRISGTVPPKIIASGCFALIISRPSRSRNRFSDRSNAFHSFHRTSHFLRSPRQTRTRTTDRSWRSVR